LFGIGYRLPGGCQGVARGLPGGFLGVGWGLAGGWLGVPRDVSLGTPSQPPRKPLEIPMHQ